MDEELYEDGWENRIIGTFHDKKKRIRISTTEKGEEQVEEDINETEKGDRNEIALQDIAVSEKGKGIQRN